MSEKPRVQHDFTDFLGMYVSDNADSLEPGQSNQQINIKSDEKGSAHVRLGYLPVSFDSTV